MLFENDFIEVSRNRHPVPWRDALGCIICITHFVAIPIEHRAGNHKQIAALARPHPYQSLQPFPGVLVKLFLLRSHVRIDVGVNHHCFGAFEIGVGSEMSLVESRFQIVVALGRGVVGETRVASEAVEAVSHRGHILFRQTISDPERDAQVIIVPRHIIALVQQMFVRGVGCSHRHPIRDMP